MISEEAKFRNAMAEELQAELLHLRSLIHLARTEGVAEADIFDRVFDGLGGYLASDELACMAAALIAREIRRELRREDYPGFAPLPDARS